MGTTTTSLHVLIPRGAADTVADTIAKSIEKLGYKRLKKPAADSDKHVVLVCPEGARFASVFDRDNATLDSGELRELAALVTQKLKTAALHTSVLDSDRGEVVVYHRGRQVDAVGGNEENDGVARIDDKAREAAWRRILHDAASTRGTDSVFADEMVAGWCRAAGLEPAVALSVFREIAADPAAIHFHFARDAARRKVPAPPATDIELRFFHDDDDRPEHLVYPAAWPVRAGTAHTAQWFAVSEGPGFSAVRIRLGIDPESGLSVYRIALSSSPFHNGQVMGNPVATFEWRASASQPVWKLGEAIEIPDFPVPTPAAGSRSRQLLMLSLAIGAKRTADGAVRPVIEVTAPAPYVHAFTPLRFAVIEPAWKPMAMRPLPVRRSAADPMYPAESTREDACLLLNGTGIVSAFAVLAERDAALRSIGALADLLLKACSDDAQVVLRTETPMTASGNSSKAQFETFASECMDSPNAAKMFASPGRYQNASIEVWAPGLAAPVAGFLYYVPVAMGYEDQGTLALHACAWCIDTPQVADGLGITGSRLRALFERWIEDAAPLQGWYDDSAWRPLPQTPDGGGVTPYELVAGVYSMAITAAQHADACRRHLRCVAPVMWLGDDLLAHVDRAALERVAIVRATRGAARIELRKDATRDDLERALEAILPGPA